MVFNSQGLLQPQIKDWRKVDRNLSTRGEEDFHRGCWRLQAEEDGSRSDEDRQRG